MIGRTGAEDGGEGARAPRRGRHAVLHRLRFRGRDLRIEAYHGYGTRETVYLKGRVLRDPGIREADADAGYLRNLGNSLRRALTDEVPYARVRARFGDSVAEGPTDREGYFYIPLPLAAPPATDTAWHTVQLELLDPLPRGGEAVRAEAEVLIPPEDSELGIISDIDDTIVRTEATNLLRMLRIVLLTSAHSRMPFDHVDSLYRALKRGSDGARTNPIFYVSSSPWNFFDLLKEFFRVHDIPKGPLFLRDWDFSPRKVLGMGHQEHKLVRIRHLFDRYPGLSFLLIGDSGQEDPEIYREIALEQPDRVVAIYIRSVTTPARDGEVRAFAEEVRAAGVEMLLVREKKEAAEHAVEKGLIPREALSRMRAEDARAEAIAEAEAGLLEKVVNPDAR
jgi:phosphatidate phosphatase APP1